MGADERVFEQLKLKAECIPLIWIKPKHKEPIADYAKRLSASIDQSEEYVILGVSFGGLVAGEMSQFLSPKLSILVSSVEIADELPKLFRFFGKLKILRWLPKAVYNPPKVLFHMAFQTDNKSILNQIIEDSDPSFHKWAINELVNWKNQSRLPSVLKIEGSSDRLMPPTKDPKAVLIEGGKHFMIYDRAKEISAIINAHIAEL